MASTVQNSGIKLLPSKAKEDLQKDLLKVIAEVKEFVANSSSNSTDIANLIAGTEKIQAGLTADAIVTFIEKYVLISTQLQQQQKGLIGSSSSDSLDVLKSQVNILNESYIKLSTDLNSLSKTVSSLSGSDITDISSSVDTLKSDVISLDNRLDIAETDILNNTSDIGSLDSRLDTAESDIDSLQSSLTNKVSGPASVTDNRIVRFDGTTGKLIQQSNVSIDDSGNITFITTGSKVDGRDISVDGTTLDNLSSSFDLVSGSFLNVSSSFIVLSQSFVDVSGAYVLTSQSFGIVSSSYLELSNSYSIVSKSFENVSSSFIGVSASLNAHIGSVGSTAHGNATTSDPGFMSPTDKSKLDGIENKANAFYLPSRLSGSITPTYITDWNNATENGWYGNSTTFTNAPTNNSYVGMAFSWASGYVTQIVYRVTDDLVFRRRCSGGSWGDWAEMPNGLSDTSPSDIDSSTGDPGSSLEAARIDHVHAHGDLSGGSLHATATTSSHGFMSSTDKTNLNNLVDLTGSLTPFYLPARLSGSATDNTLTDWDDAIESGWYSAFYPDGAGDFVTASNGPGTSADTFYSAMVITPLISSGTTYVQQIAYELSFVEPSTYTRSGFISGSSSFFGDWVEIPSIITTNAAQTITSSLIGSAGTSSEVARADHVHSHGKLLGGDLHDVATTSLAGFLSAADKTLLDTITTGSYTPTITAGANVTINAVGAHRYARVGNFCIVWGHVNMDNTGSGSFSFNVSLPIASNLSSSPLRGATTVSNSSWLYSSISYDTVDNEALITHGFSSSRTSSPTYVFVYLIE